MKKTYESCECPARGMCCNGYGPAAYLVERDGKKLKLCTRCDLSGDKRIKILVKKSQLEEYFDFDPLGGMVLAMDLNEKK